MFPKQDHGRMSVSEDGTLTIEPVQREDAGQYICKGLSIAGSAYAKARLDVRGPLLCTLFSCLAINCVNVRKKEGTILARVRTNRRAIAMMFVRLSETGVHCDHTVHVSADLSLWLDSPVFWAP